MRKILFRGKTDKGEWVVGLPTREHPFDKKINRIQLLDDYYENDITEFFYVKNVIPETVGQYTGLTDKNGKKIFEGDIIDIEYPITTVKCAVIEYVGSAFVGSTDCDAWDLDDYYALKVIGNIHDNPELLKGE